MGSFRKKGQEGTKGKRFSKADTRKLIEEALSHLAEEDPDFLAKVLSTVVFNSLLSLRRYVEDPKEPDINWESPWAELRFPVEVNWGEEGEFSLIHAAPMEEEDERAFKEKLSDALLEHSELILLRTLTNATAYLKRGNSYFPSLQEPERWKEATADLTEEEQEAFFEALFEPFTIGAFYHEGLSETAEAAEKAFEQGEEKVPLGLPESCFRELSELAENAGGIPIEGKLEDGRTFSAHLALAFFPLVADLEERTAYYPVQVGLVFTGEAEDPLTWSDADRRNFWTALLREIGKPWEEVEEPTPTPTPTPTPEPQVVPAPMGLPFRGTIVDAASWELVRHAQNVELRPRYSNLKPWGEFREEYLQELLESGSEEERSLLIRDLGVRKDGSRAVALTAEGDRRLKISAGTRGPFRYEDEGTRKEYLARVVRARGAHYLIALSWGGLARGWTREGLEELEREEKDARQELPFTPGRAEDLEFTLRNVKDARKLMGTLLSLVSFQATNEVVIPAEALRVLFEIEKNPRWKLRLEGAFEALKGCHFLVEALETKEEKVSGVLSAGWAYFGRGGGKHRDGDFRVHVNPGFVRCFNLFKSRRLVLKQGEEIFRYDTSKTLTEEDRKLYRPRRLSSGLEFYATAANLTENQKALMVYLGDQITLRKDGVSRKLGDVEVRLADRVNKNAKDAGEPRLYGSDFCPLLPEGRLYHGALGHFTRNPETGRKLAGTPKKGSKTGGSRPGGLLYEMGYTLPPGRNRRGRVRIVDQALVDLHRVVEDYLEGVVAVRVPGKAGGWRTLDQTKNLPRSVLQNKATFFLFLPENWEGLANQKWEHYQAKRAKRGETPHAWKVTTTQEEADRARMASGRVDLVDLEKDPLHWRLRQARNERNLSQAAVARLFGVSQVTLSRWENWDPDEGRGKPIAEELFPLVLRWIEEETPPTPAELDARRARGRRKTKG